MINIDSIFKLTPYSVARTSSHYPTFRLRKEMPILFRSVEDAERDMLTYNGIFPYCFALSEMPVGMQFFIGESFSERIYLPDGQLWGKRLYSNIKPLDIPPQYGEIEFDNYIYGRGLFSGRKPEEIRFKRGDIIEIFCYKGNDYWSEGNAELAIVVDTPPTESEMEERFKYYLAHEKPHLTGDRGFDLGVRFGSHKDAYTVISAYLPENTEPTNLIDHCSTHCAMLPRLDVSSRTRAKLERMLDKAIAAHCL